MDTSDLQPTLLSELLASSPAAKPLKETGKLPFLLDLARERYWSFFVSCFEDRHTRWTWYEGDLDIDGDLTANDIVVVSGDVRVSGNLYGTSGLLFVLGSLSAQNVMTCWSLAAVGPIDVEGLLFVHYNDHVFRAGDRLRARAFVVDDMDADYGRGKLEVEAYVSDQLFQPEASEAACRVFAPDLISVEKLIDSFPDRQGDEPFLVAPLVPDVDECYRRLRSGTPVFRDATPPPELGRWIMRALEAGADGDLEDALLLRGRDPLVDRILDAYVEAASQQIPRRTNRMRAVAADRARLEPMGVDLMESLRATGSPSPFTGTAESPRLEAQVNAVANSWIRSEVHFLLKEIAGKATLVQQDVSVQGAARVSEPLIIDGDLVVDGTLALDSAPLVVTGNLRVKNAIATKYLCVLGNLQVAEVLAGRCQRQEHATISAAGACSARLILLDNLFIECGAGEPKIADGPNGEYGEWESAMSAAAHAALVPSVVDFEALLDDFYEYDTEFPPVAPGLDFPAAWTQLAAHGTLLRTSPPTDTLPAQLVNALIAVRARSPQRLNELRSLDPLLERIASVYA